MGAFFSLGGSGGIRTHVPGTDNRISSAARYDHFDTLPYELAALAASNIYHNTSRYGLQAQFAYAAFKRNF